MRSKPAIAKALSAIAAVIVAATGGRADRRYSPKTYPDSGQGRRPRRAARNARNVERAVIDQWLMWRN